MFAPSPRNETPEQQARTAAAERLKQIEAKFSSAAPETILPVISLAAATLAAGYIYDVDALLGRALISALRRARPRQAQAPRHHANEIGRECLTQDVRLSGLA